MRALVLDRYKTTPQLRDLPSPEPGPGDLLVDIHAASVNPVDTKTRDGGIKILVNYRTPFVLGNDLSGVVAKVGPGVNRFKVGDAVYARLDKDRIGAFAEQVLIRESAAAVKPKNLTHVEAASIPLVGLTTWQALVGLAKLEKGQSVLIHAGSGGLGTFAIQFAHQLGARVATTVSARNEALVRGLGADVVVDYRSTQFEKVVRDVDVVLDTQGGDTLMRSFQVIKPGGMIVSVNGVPDGKFGKTYGLNPFLVAALSLMTWKVTRAAKKSRARFEWLFMRASGEQLSKITTLIEEGKIRPVIDRVFPLGQALEALAYSETGRATGKVVIQVR
jgi:alcohol dehydrogenase